MICFKLKAGSHLPLSRRPLNQIATELCIQPSMQRSWQGAVGGQKFAGVVGSGFAAAPSAEQAEVRRLRRELGRPRMVRDADLRGESWRVEKSRIARLMRHHGIRGHVAAKNAAFSFGVIYARCSFCSAIGCCSSIDKVKLATAV